MVEIAGTVPERFTKVADALAQSIDDGAEVGGSVAIAIDGELVADFWGGFADEARTKPWEREPIVNVWSTTKTMTALTALVLADRGARASHHRAFARRDFRDEIAGPLDADFHIGLAPEHDARVSPVIPPPPLELDLAGEIDMDSPAMKTFTGPPVDASHANTEAWRRAEIGAANGHGNARSVARIQSAITNGGSVDGVTLLSPATIERIFEVQADGIDLVLGIPLKFGIGYGLPVAETIPYLPADSRICFWGGWGGSVVINDLDRRMTFAFMMNRMAEGIIGGQTAAGLLTETYASVGP